MKLSDYRQTYYELSGKASDIARNLAFAGIALVWIFKTERETATRFPEDLFLPSILLVLSLSFDLLQYLAGACVWGIFQWYHERKLENISQDPELDSSSALRWPQFFFFIAKMITIALAYFFLLKFTWTAWFESGIPGV